MIQNESMVNVIDNTGALKAKVIRVLKWSFGKRAIIGDKVVLAVKQAKPNGSVKSWDVVKGVVVRTRKEIRRKDGSYIRFGDNAVVLIKNDGSPIWKRIFGPIAREIRDKGFYQVAKLAEEVI
jgi:large subunit ribosomal protein L14